MTPELIELAFKGLGVFGLVLVALTYLFKIFRQNLVDDEVRKDVLGLLRDQLDEFRKQLDIESAKAELFARERNEAVADLKKWEYAVNELNAEVIELRQQLKKTEESNEALRHYIQDVMKAIQMIVIQRPETFKNINLPDYPQI